MVDFCQELLSLIGNSWCFLEHFTIKIDFEENEIKDFIIFYAQHGKIKFYRNDFNDTLNLTSKSLNSYYCMRVCLVSFCFCLKPVAQLIS